MKIFISKVIAVIGAVVAIGFSSYAQKQPAQDTKSQEKTEAQMKEELRKSPVSIRAVEKLRSVSSSKRQEFKLIGARFDERVFTKGHISSSDIVLLNGGISVFAIISEYESAEHAGGLLKIHVNARVVKGNKFGDEDKKIYGWETGFSSLSFRKGKFSVFIDCPRHEEIADEVAKAISEAIAEQR